MNKILIDTNIYSEFMRGDDKVKYILSVMEVIGISVISIGELLSGFKGGINEEKIEKS
ncbi:MAG: PIN domain-containing protein [Candidatus Humimicrobiaceae bacterium]